MNYLNKIKELGIDIEKGASLKRYNTFKLDQKSKSVARVNNQEQLKVIINIFKEFNEVYEIIGKGSNILFTSKAQEINFIVLTGDYNKFELLEDNGVYVGSGMGIVPFSVLMAKKGLSGLEFAHGIPGSIGGAVVMNAGAHGSDFSNIIDRVKVFDPEEEVIKMINKKDLSFSYRFSNIVENEYIVLGAELSLHPACEKTALKETMHNKDLRVKTQPLKKRTCGSVFKNPDSDFAAKLLEDCNLKGLSIGGAKFSSKHANFIEVGAGSTYKDILSLIYEAKKEVLDKKCVTLHTEVKIY